MNIRLAIALLLATLRSLIREIKETINVRLVLTFVLAILCALGSDIWLVPDDKRLTIWGGQIWGYMAIFGIFFCISLVIFAKLVGQLWLQRPNDYYEEDEHAHD